MIRDAMNGTIMSLQNNSYVSSAESFSIIYANITWFQTVISYIFSLSDILLPAIKSEIVKKKKVNLHEEFKDLRQLK